MLEGKLQPLASSATLPEGCTYTRLPISPQLIRGWEKYEIKRWIDHGFILLSFRLFENVYYFETSSVITYGK
nr:MAG: hypothetical protein EDM05_29490 [Leptolyngbya sp. IPPAS B-1204]